MSEDVRHSRKLHKAGKNSRRKFLPYRHSPRYVRTLEKLWMQCEKVKVYTGPISKWLYARAWVAIRLYGVAERIQDIGRTPYAYIAQVASACIALWWAFCLIRRPELLGTSIYLKALKDIGTLKIIAAMVAMGFYQLGSVIFGPSQREIQQYVTAGRQPYPGTRFWLTVVGLSVACGIWTGIAYLTYKSGGLNMGMGSYAVLSILQTVAAIQIARVFTIARRDAIDKREEAARRAALSASHASPVPALGVASSCSPTQLPISR